SPGAYGGGLRAGADLLKLFGGHFSSSFFARAFLAHAMARSIARYPRPAAAPAMQSQSRVSRGVIGSPPVGGLRARPRVARGSLAGSGRAGVSPCSPGPEDRKSVVEGKREGMRTR